MCKKCGYEEKHLRLALQSCQDLMDLHKVLIDSCNKTENEESFHHLMSSADRVNASIDLLMLAFPGINTTDNPELAGEIVNCDDEDEEEDIKDRNEPTFDWHDLD